MAALLLLIFIHNLQGFPTIYLFLKVYLVVHWLVRITYNLNHQVGKNNESYM